MPSAGSTSGTGRNHAARGITSPTYSASPLPPKIKLHIRPNSPSPSPSSSKRNNSHSRQRTYQFSNSDSESSASSSSSDLTPVEEDDGDDDDHDVHMGIDESMITPRKGVHKGRNTPTQQPISTKTSITKKKNISPTKAKAGTKIKTKTTGKKKSHPTTTTTITTTGSSGPAGRDKKRAIKLEEASRRRARDAKFDVDASVYAGVTPTQSSANLRQSMDEDSASSYGDDESEIDDNAHGHELNLISEVQANEEQFDIPDGFAGQEIEDLAYGAGDFDLDQPMSNFWDETESSDTEDDEPYINQLSESELDQQSQSSVNETESEDPESESDFSSSSDDGLDEFGFPVPSASLFPIGENDDGENGSGAAGGGVDQGLILMENWDGQFVLVQPRNERSRSRHRGDKGSGSRTNGSNSGSTTLSATDQQALIIDQDAEDNEFYEDESDEDSYWSGMSDEDDGRGGDTTDSMEEEDMPMLDSPALNELMEAQMAEAVLRMAVETGEITDFQLNPVASPEAMEVMSTNGNGGPSIVVTNPNGGMDVHTPALSTSSSNGPTLGQSSSTPSTSTLPQTPGAPTPNGVVATSSGSVTAPPVPIMGTFHPITDDPAQHAVIDGSGTATKSPFTHRRRSRRARDDVESVTSSNIYRTGSGGGSRGREGKEKKRKSSNATNITTYDPFSPIPIPTHSRSARALSLGAQKRARYSSIPGHPRYVAACKAQAIAGEREETPSDSDAFSLEDMLDASVLLHEMEDQSNSNSNGGAGGEEGETEMDQEHLRHMIRFDRVGVSTYLRRNFNNDNNNQNININHGLGAIGALDHTLVGPVGLGSRGMLVSPILAPTPTPTNGERERERGGKKKRRGTTGSSSNPGIPQSRMAPLQI